MDGVNSFVPKSGLKERSRVQNDGLKYYCITTQHILNTNAWMKQTENIHLAL